MKNFKYLVLIFIGFCISFFFEAKAQNNLNLEEWLSQTKGITFEKTPLDSLHQFSYTIFVSQYIDHQNPEEGRFTQKVYLTHIDKALPMVMVTEGYTANRNYISEPAKVFGLNQIIVEHRYFGESVPDSVNWSQLTTKNAAEDHHHIYELFSQFYGKKWMSTGVSKGGQTSIFYKYYHPKDMYVSIPYVAPLNLEQEDPRINWFLRHVASPEDDARILNYQRLMLENFDKIFPIFTDIAKKNNKDFAVNDTLAYEFMVLEFPFSYFQWGSMHIDSIPLKFKSVKQMLKPMQRLGLVNFYYKSTLDGLMPFMVQAYRELGYYDYDLDSLDTYLLKMENSSNIAFLPEELRFPYEADIMNNVYDFIHNEGNRMVFVYGELDPWSSTSVNPDSRTDAIKLVLSGGSHSTRLRHFDKEKYNMVVERVKTWLKDE